MDCTLSPSQAQETAADWLDRASRAAAMVGLGPPNLLVTRNHLSLTLASPPDLRQLAVEALDWAIGEAGDATLEDIDARPDRPLRALYAAAQAAGVPVFHDANEVVLGFGAGARRLDRWTLKEDAVADAVSGIQRVPIVRVTGTNGKTTTAHLIAAMAAAAGAVPGISTSVGVRVGSETRDTSALSTGQASRQLARDPRVNFAVLETGRGGLMRHGLPFDNADVVVITNIGADHLGDWGIETLEELARAKLTVAESLRPGGTLVVNGDDPVLASAIASWSGRPRGVEIVRFSAQHPDHGWADREVLHVAGLELPIAEVPLTLGGAARINVENALAAALAARAVGLPSEAVARGLKTTLPADNPGRCNLFVLRGACVLIDNASNPGGIERLGELARALDSERVLLLLGPGRHRTDPLIRASGLAAAALGCVRYVLKPPPSTAEAESTRRIGVLAEALREGGVGDERIAVADTERDGVRIALDHLAPGDLALLLIHEDLSAALDLLDAAGAVAG